MQIQKIIHASGKRKSAVARATLYPGRGRVRVNRQLLDAYGSELTRLKIMEPLLLTGDKVYDVDVDVMVAGGGKNGQTEAVRLAVARALVEYDKRLKKTFEEYDRLLLVADVRRKETRKPNRQSKARARVQKSYR